MTRRLITLELKPFAALVRLNRPERHNALVPELLRDLLDTLQEPGVKQSPVLVLAAKGRSFSTGGDLQGFWQHRQSIGQYARELVGLLNEAILALYTHPVPVACAVQGLVTGGALGLLLGADRVIMQRGASITPWYSKIGFSPDGGWTALLPSIIGRQQTANWLYGNCTETAERCLDLGLVHDLTDTNPVAAALAWAQQVSALEPSSIGHTKALLKGETGILRARLEAERELFVQQVQTPQARAGIARFLGQDQESSRS